MQHASVHVQPIYTRAGLRHGNVTMSKLRTDRGDARLRSVFGGSGDLSKATWGIHFPVVVGGPRRGEGLFKLGSLRETGASLAFLKGQTGPEIGYPDAVVGDCSLRLGVQSPKTVSPSSMATDGRCQWSVEKPIRAATSA